MESIFETKKIKVGVVANCTKESITNDYNNYKNRSDDSEDVYDFKGFIGGWEVTPDTKFEAVVSVDDEGVETSVDYTYEQRFVHRLSVDGTKLFIASGKPNNGAQGYADSESFIRLADKLGIANVYTKSEMIALLDSAEYTITEDEDN